MVEDEAIHIPRRHILGEGVEGSTPLDSILQVPCHGRGGPQWAIVFPDMRITGLLQPSRSIFVVGTVIASIPEEHGFNNMKGLIESNGSDPFRVLGSIGPQMIDRGLIAQRQTDVGFLICHAGKPTYIPDGEKKSKPFSMIWAGKAH